MVVAEHGDITSLPKNVRGNLNELDTRFLIKSQLVKFYSHNMIEGLVRMAAYVVLSFTT